MIDCAYPDCPVPALSQCEACPRTFCSDHRTHSADRQVQEVGAVAYPCACWEHGGFNADA